MRPLPLPMRLDRFYKIDGTVKNPISALCAISEEIHVRLSTLNSSKIAQVWILNFLRHHLKTDFYETILTYVKALPAFMPYKEIQRCFLSRILLYPYQTEGFHVLKKIEVFKENDFSEKTFKKLLVHDSPYFKIINFNFRPGQELPVHSHDIEG